MTKRISGIGTKPKEGGAPFYFLLYSDKESGEYVAHCLNFNVIFMSSNPLTALTGLSELLTAHIAHLVSLGADAAPVKGASDEYWEAYVNGWKLPVPPGFELNLRIPDNFKITSPKKQLHVKPQGHFSIALADKKDLVGV